LVPPKDRKTGKIQEKRIKVGSEYQQLELVRQLLEIDMDS